MLTLSRQFVKKAVAAILLVALLAVPIYAGTVVLLSPLRQEPTIHWNRVAPLSSVDDDGIPQLFRSYVSPVDVWTQLPDQEVDSVYLRRSLGSDAVTALAATHQSNMLIPVLYDAELGTFKSLCWKVLFSLSGKCLENDPRLEDMQTLQTKVVDGIVWVEAR